MPKLHTLPDGTVRLDFSFDELRSDITQYVTSPHLKDRHLSVPIVVAENSEGKVLEFHFRLIAPGRSERHEKE